MMPPSGTPVCLIEKTNESFSGDAVLINKCELAGVMGP
jgi:hypothetical protein